MSASGFVLTVVFWKVKANYFQGNTSALAVISRDFHGEILTVHMPFHIGLIKVWLRNQAHSGAAVAVWENQRKPCSCFCAHNWEGCIWLYLLRSGRRKAFGPERSSTCHNSNINLSNHLMADDFPHTCEFVCASPCLWLQCLPWTPVKVWGMPFRD